MICGGLVGLIAACKPPAPVSLPPLPAPASGIYYDEELRAVQQVRLEIADLREAVSADKRQVTITGTLINRGTRPTSAVSLRVGGLDLVNRRVITGSGESSSKTIPADGGTATFVATLENRPDVVRYHVEAIAR